jgi:predicted TIM-barrel fold metal-dependent hydrolase
MAEAFPYPLITLEEHYLSKAAVDYYAANGLGDPFDAITVLSHMRNDLVELGDKRLESMKKNGISLQVVSHAANSHALDEPTCQKINDEISQSTHARTERFAAFATLPMSNPPAAAEELRRCVQKLGFVGALTDNTDGGKFFDDPFYWPVFEAAQDLDVPIYIHPTVNEQVRPLLHDGNYPEAVSRTLNMHVWGWHSENALHIIRLFAAGVFDKFPRLKIIIGHNGEMLPFQLDRIERVSSNQWPLIGHKLQRNLRTVWDENIWITTSGMFSLAPMATIVRQCKPDHILYSVDYPFVKNEWGLKFMEELRADGMISEEILEGIAYKNAEKLLRVKARPYCLDNEL